MRVTEQSEQACKAKQLSLKHPALYGLDDSHLVTFGHSLLTRETAIAFEKMQRQAALEGIDLQICSAYRDFMRQMAIWNGKAEGKRPLLDLLNQPMEITGLSDDELVDAILLWSALPGASRHHWGTDIDVFDASRICKADLQLISDEYVEKGPCATLAIWLEKHAQTFGFYFPYQADKSGVSPEPWHLSYFPESSQFLSQYHPDSLRQLLSQSEITLQSALLNKLDNLVEQYVFFVADAPSC